MPGLLGNVGQFLGFGGQPAQQPGGSLRDQVEQEQLRRLQQPAPPPGFEGKTPAGSIPRIMVDVATRLQSGQPISQQDALRFNFARDRAAQGTTAFRNGVLTTTPGLSPEALSRFPSTQQVFSAVGGGGAPLPGQGAPAPMPAPLGTEQLPVQQGNVAPRQPFTQGPGGPVQQPFAQPQGVPQQAPQAVPQQAPQAAPTGFDITGQNFADAPAEQVPGLPSPKFINVPTDTGQNVRVVDPAFNEARKADIAGITKRGNELEDTRPALSSVRQLFGLSKNTPTGSFQSMSLPIRNFLASVLPEGFDLIKLDRDKIARQQMFDALQTRMVPINRAGTPGQVSNIEFQAYKDASASLSNLPGANMILAGGLLQQRARTEALQAFVNKAVMNNPGLSPSQAAKMFERKVEDQLRNHPSGGFIVEAKSGSTMPMINFVVEGGSRKLGQGARAAHASLPPDTLFRGANGKMYMTGNAHTDPFRDDYVGVR